MMDRHRSLHGARRAETGATLVEFALVAPIVFMLIFGLIAGCFLAYQNSALHDGATAGARLASIESPLVSPTPNSNGLYCESGNPGSIAKAVDQAAPLLTVSQGALCASSDMATSMTQQNVNGDVNIVVTCSVACATLSASSNPAFVEVSLTLSTQGLVAPIGLTYNLSATSQVPIESP